MINDVCTQYFDKMLRNTALERSPYIHHELKFLQSCSVYYRITPFCGLPLTPCPCLSGEVDPKERLARQRKLLQRKLGLDMGAAIGMDTEELFNDEDLDYTCTPSGPKAQGGKGSACSSSRNRVVSHTASTPCYYPVYSYFFSIVRN